MPDQTARDAVAGSIFNATFTAEWDDCPDGYQETRAMILRDADAILAALGIPPDTTTDEVRAGLAALRILADGIDRYATTPLRLVKCEGGYQAYRPVYRGECGTPSASPAAAVLAFAAKQISAGLWFLAHAGSVDVSQRQGGTWVARDRDRYSIRGVGASPAAAIHALAAKLAEAQR